MPGALVEDAPVVSVGAAVRFAADSPGANPLYVASGVGSGWPYVVYSLAAVMTSAARVTLSVPPTTAIA